MKAKTYTVVIMACYVIVSSMFDIKVEILSHLIQFNPLYPSVLREISVLVFIVHVDLFIKHRSSLKKSILV